MFGGICCAPTYRLTYLLLDWIAGGIEKFCVAAPVGSGAWVSE